MIFGDPGVKRRCQIEGRTQIILPWIYVRSVRCQILSPAAPENLIGYPVTQSSKHLVQVCISGRSR